MQHIEANAVPTLAYKKKMLKFQHLQQFSLFYSGHMQSPLLPDYEQDPSQETILRRSFTGHNLLPFG